MGRGQLTNTALMVQKNGELLTSAKAGGSGPLTSPSGPTASASRKLMSPLPQHTSSTRLPRRARLHPTVMRFQTLCSPMLSRSFSSS